MNCSFAFLEKIHSHNLIPEEIVVLFLSNLARVKESVDKSESVQGTDVGDD